MAAGDLLAVADVSASESRKITVTDFLGNAVTLVADGTIPSGKILFGANTITGSALVTGSVDTPQITNNAVTAEKLADFSSATFVSALPAVGDFRGQLAIDVVTLATYAWDGSQWRSLKAAGSVNAIVGSSAGIVNVTISQVGDTVTIGTTLDDTTAAAQFLAGPSGAPGTASYRAIVGADLPAATATSKGSVQVNGNGLTMSGDTLAINNTVAPNTAVFHVVEYNANGLVTNGRIIQAGDLPLASTGLAGAVYPGTGLAVSTDGQLNHVNSVGAGTYTKVTVDVEGHVTAGDTLAAADIPQIDANKIATGEFTAERIATNAITGAKLANLSVTQIGGSTSTQGVVQFPVAEFTGQYFFDAISNDLYLWDGNAWQAITITAGEIVYAGTFDASAGSGTGEIASLTTAGSALGLTVGTPLPAASEANNRYYLVVSVGGTVTSGNAPNVALSPPDMILSNGTSWEEIDVSTSVIGATQASNITFTPAGNIQAVNVQTALQELDSEKIGAAGATITGELLIGATGSLVFEGATADNFETTLAVVDPTADRTITLPNVNGTVITTGDTGTVTNTMLAGSIALSKLVSLTSGNIIVGSSGNVPTATAITGDVTLSSSGVTAIAAGVIIDADISASAGISFSKLATLNSGAVLVGSSGNVATAVTPTGDITISNAGVTSIAAGVIVNADVNASAAIAGTKIAPNFGAQNVATTGTVSDGKGDLRNIPQNAQTAAYTLIAADAGKHISITTGGVTVPSGVFAVGEAVTIFNNSSSSQTLTQGSSVTLRQGGTTNTGNRTLAEYGLATLLCVATNTFVITGAGVT